jgi:hypothetical protein
MTSDRKMCMYVCAAVLMYKTSVNPVHYIRIFVRPVILVLRVDHLYTLLLHTRYFMSYPSLYGTLGFYFVWILYRSLCTRHVLSLVFVLFLTVK